MTCDHCKLKSQCKQMGYCVKQGKPWEPQDDKRTVQADSQWWSKQQASDGRIKTGRK